MRIISWNLLHLTGAGLNDLATLIRQHRPDLLLLQEATEDLAALPAIVGGQFFRTPLDRRIYGLAAWSPHALAPPDTLPLPASPVPGHVPPRVAQILQLQGIVFANVHLSHGQVLNRRQLIHIAYAFDGPIAVVGDFNAVGPIKLPGFRDVGPRQATHTASNIISFRLDRCMARGLRCSQAQVLDRGPSDHHPIVLHLHVVPEAAEALKQDKVRGRPVNLQAGMERWLRVKARAPEFIRVPQSLFEQINLRSRKQRRSKLQGRRLVRANTDDIVQQHLDDRASLGKHSAELRAEIKMEEATS